MQKNLFLLLFIFAFSFSYAQKEDLIKNENFTWIAEGYQDIVFEQSNNPNYSLEKGIASPIKYINELNDDSPTENLLPYLLFNAIKAKKLTLYSNTDCKTPNMDMPLIFIDTISTLDKEINEIRTSIERKEIAYDSISFFRVHQLYYYDEKNVRFGVQSLAIAPMQQYRRYDGTINYRTMGWLKIKNLNGSINLEDKNLKWATSVRSANVNLFDSKEVKILKKGNKQPYETYTETLQKNANIPVFISPFSQMQVPSEEIFTKIEEQTQTFDDKIVIITSKVTGIAPVQNWYWDSTKNELQCENIANGMLYMQENQKGEKSPYPVILFYRKNKN